MATTPAKIEDVSLNDFPKGKSRSLVKICNGPEDVIGLIAYSLFKFEQSEWAEARQPEDQEVDSHHQTLQLTRVESLRSNAEQRLGEWIESLEEEWYRENYEAIKSDVAEAVAQEVRNEVVSEFRPLLNDIKQQGGIREAIVANLIAWIITIAATTLIALYLLAPAFLELLKEFGKS